MLLKLLKLPQLLKLLGLAALLAEIFQLPTVRADGVECRGCNATENCRKCARDNTLACHEWAATVFYGAGYQCVCVDPFDFWPVGGVHCEIDDPCAHFGRRVCGDGNDCMETSTRRAGFYCLPHNPYKFTGLWRYVF